jgi:hypothetical protein
MIVSLRGAHMTEAGDPMPSAAAIVLIGCLEGRPSVDTAPDGQVDIRFILRSRPEWPPMLVWAADGTIVEMAWVPTSWGRPLRLRVRPRPFRYAIRWRHPYAPGRAAAWTAGAILAVVGESLETAEVEASRVQWLSSPN